MENRYTLRVESQRIILQPAITLEGYTTKLIVEKWDGDEWQRQAELVLDSADLDLLFDFLDEITYMCKP